MNSIYNHNGVTKIISLFAKGDNWHNLDLNKGNLGYGWIHYALIRNLQPNSVLCIGSRYGLIPAICALACRDNQKGMVDFVDAGYDQNNPQDINHWGGVGLWTKIDPNHYFNKFNLGDFIHLHPETSREFYIKNKNRVWKYIHIDGDHSYKGVKSDFDSFWPLLEHGGVMAIHDIYPEKIGSLKLGVANLWRQLKKVKKYNMFELPGMYGLGLIQK